MYINLYDTKKRERTNMQQSPPTGYVKIGNNYINPYNINQIAKNADGTTSVIYNSIAQGPWGIAPTQDRIPINTDKFAQCAIKAMQTGEIIDVMV